LKEGPRILLRTVSVATKAILVAAILAACGGSGGSGTSAEPSETPDGITFTALSVVGAPQLALGDFILVNSQRVSRTVFDYTYTAVAHNNGPANVVVRALLTSTAASTTVVDGELDFGEVSRGASATSTDTFTIRQDRSVPFDSAALIWAVEATPTIKVVVDHSSILLDGVGQSADLSAQVRDSLGAPLSAIIGWSSSAPDKVRVDSTGRIEALEIGSAQIFAEADGVRSLPVFVVVVQTVPGTVLVTDAQVVSVGPPLNLAPGTIPGPGTRYEVRLRNLAATPAPGTVMLAAEEALVAGKVAEVRDDAGELIVTLELAPLYELLADYDIDWTIDLASFDLIPATGENPAAAARAPGDRAQAQAVTLAAARVRPRALGTRAPPFDCEAQIEARLLTRQISMSVTGEPQLVVEDAPGRTKRAITGTLKLTGSAKLKLDAQFGGSGTCKAEATVNIPVGGIIAVVLMPSVRIGVAASLSGSLSVVPAEVAATGSVGVSGVYGWECGGATPDCRALEQTTPINEFKLTGGTTLPGSPGMRVDLTGQLYAFLALDVTFLLVLPKELLVAKFGPEQVLDLGFPNDQALLPNYASKYDLKLKGVLEPGSAISDHIKNLIDDENVSLSFGAETSIDISESPKGTLSVDKTTVAQDAPVVFTVDLRPTTTNYFLLDYNVTGVELWRRKADETDFTLFKTIPVSASNQTRFTYQWTPAAADLGENEFAAFVDTKFPVPVLEVEPDSIRKVTVSCFSVAPPAPASASAGRQFVLATTAAATGICRDWAGTSTVQYDDANTFLELQANVAWIYDRPGTVLELQPNYYPTGTVTITKYTDKRCGREYLFSPRSWTMDVNDDDGPDGIMSLDYTETVPTVSFSGGTTWLGRLTTVCDDTPITIDNQLLGGFWLLTPTPLPTISPDGLTIQGSYTDGEITVTYRFTRQ
jgi:hypothetical protein